MHALVFLLLFAVPVAPPSAPSSVGVPGQPSGKEAAVALPTITYKYSVRGRGNSTDLEAFASLAAETLADARGWSLGGSIAFERVESGGHFTLWLAAPRHVPKFGKPCHWGLSCCIGRNVIINEARWTGASDAWNAVGVPLRDYQHMVLNHEVGHRLGLVHQFCAGKGRTAPVMQQQTLGLQRCKPNGWPTVAERKRLSKRKGAPVIEPVEQATR